MIIKNTLKATIRHLLKNKLYLSVNILSLAVGLTCCLFAFKYILFEFSYDRFHTDADSIYRIEYQTVTEDGTNLRFANLHGNVIPEGIASIPEIELNTRFATHADLNIEVGEQQFGESEIIAAENSFFSLFNFKFITGTRKNALSDPNFVVLNKSTALKYFYTSDAIGKTLTIKFQGKEILLTVSGVIVDVPKNSHFKFDIVTSTEVYEKLYGFSIYDVQLGYNYIRLFNGVDDNIVQKKINEIIPVSKPRSEITYFLRALPSIHLYSSARGELSTNSDIKYLFLLAIITLIILGIACVNFTTLTTALSLKRSTEVGIRKAYGALRSNLVSGFLTEGILLSLAGLLVAYFCIWQFLPFINSLTGISFTFSEFVTPPFLLAIILISIFIGSLAALYPALISTGYNSSSLLLNRASMSLKGNRFWKAVIIAQFSATLILITASYIVHQQLEFIQNKDLGFEKEQIITIPNYFGENYQPFLQQLNQHPNITSTTISSYIPGVSKSSGTALVKTEGVSQGITFDWISLDHNYLDTYGIKLKEGRNFSENRSTDSTQAFIINETAAKTLGWDNPLGKNLAAFGKEGAVIGVVKDFNFLSLHNQVSPLIMTVNDQLYFSISAKIKSQESVPETITFIQKAWEEMVPGALFSYNFADDQFAQVYKTEERAQSLFSVFSFLAVFIAVLGLFSFASFSVGQKQKEIGIRKVLGASLYDVLHLFYKGYFKFLAIAAFIAFPIAYFWMQSWLQNFFYSLKLGLDVFLFPLFIVLSTILISVSYQTIKAALTNPVDSIKTE